MNILVLPQAAEEFEAAAGHYDDKLPGLGKKFRDEVDRHIRWIVQNAEVPRLRPGGYRRLNLKVFPHYIAYAQTHDTIWILAIAHGHREPEYWIDRKGILANGEQVCWRNKGTDPTTEDSEYAEEKERAARRFER